MKKCSELMPLARATLALLLALTQGASPEEGAPVTPEGELIQDILKEIAASDDPTEVLTKHLDTRDEAVLGWIARQLGSCHTERARAALEDLLRHEQRDPSLPSVAKTAERSLARLQKGPTPEETRSLEFREFKRQYSKSENRLEVLLAGTSSTNELVLAFVAAELGNHNVAGALEALKTLMEHKQRDRTLNPVAYYAKRSMQRLSASDELEELRTGNVPFQDDSFIREIAYGKNSYAREEAPKILLARLKGGPQNRGAILDLMVQYFPQDRRLLTEIKDAREISLKRLESALMGGNVYVICGCIRLISHFEIKAAIPWIVHFLYAERTGYRNGQISYETQTALVDLGRKSLPELRRVLCSRNTYATLDAIGIIVQIRTKEALEILEAFKRAFSNAVYDEKSRAKISRKLEWAIGEIRAELPE